MLSNEKLEEIVSECCARGFVLWHFGDQQAALRLLTRCWNMIDRLAQPEPLWEVMLECCPFAFSSSNPNDMIFTY